ncbi:3-hydroxyisobutyryl-CoA hydrolase [Lithohypha guttulata]|uniref:3-hydroxyisobutyryl-CoA hydrolase n=1 Tax=Lithohypha guttulata TaxID=1690604 RepID=A0ABR0K323_9EURO|nr:3-hydroxyisobutyryl-CoA hydrolase [Lithohypha guttulata]
MAQAFLPQAAGQLPTPSKTSVREVGKCVRFSGRSLTQLSLELVVILSEAISSVTPLRCLLASHTTSAARSASSQLRSRALLPTPRVAMFSTSRQFRYASHVPKEQPGDEADDVLFGSLYGVRTVELNRPKKLNSLNGSMARKILPRLREWENSQMANMIMITGAGPKAFCAGGDVAELARNNSTKEGQQKSTDYFALEYQLDHLISTYSKPYIAIMDGITMGGGVGLSVHAPFRIATEKTVFAMPETTIGFFPDVGGSFFLSRMDGEVGTYLALTSENLHGVQALYAGIATHYLDSSVLQPLTTRLSELQFKDHASMQERLTLINNTLAEFTTELPAPDSYPKAKNGNISGELREAIDKCFSFNTVDEILAALRREEGGTGKIAEWAKATIKTIAMRSPTSLKVTLKQLRLGKNWSIGETFVREHEMAARFMQHPDFTEGVSARLINKPPTKPNWQPATLEEVSDSDVDEFFVLPEDVEPMELIEGSPASLRDYVDYPHARFGLPRERDIEAVVRNKGRQGANGVENEVLKQWNNKPGVSEKVADVLERKTTTRGGELHWKDRQRASL